MAILSVLLSSLMPLISQSLATTALSLNNQRSELLEVCTVLGTKWVSADLATDNAGGQKKTAKPPISLHSKFCDYCVTSAASFALPPFAGLVFAIPLAHFPLPFFLSQHALRLVIWLVPAVRAPPQA